MSEIIFAPASEAQSQFLLSDAFFTLYGGAAFSGKSYCLLGSLLPIIHHKGTRAVIIRKTTKQLSGSGSLFDAAIQLFSKVDPKLKIKTRDLTLVFSSGAQVQFTYLDKPADRMNLQGREYSAILFDECQQLEMDNVFYALSRLRSTMVDYPLQARATCNPDYDSFLRSFVEYSLDERGIPIRRDVYPNRYFVRTPSGIVWYDSLAEAQAAWGDKPDAGIKSWKFVPGSIFDNPKGLEQNKDYIATLKALPRVERERLLEGSWLARETASGYFKREWVNLVDSPNLAPDCKRVRAWDLAFSKPSEARPRVDATAGVLLSRQKSNGLVTVENVKVIRERVHEVEKLIFETASLDGKHVTVSLPLDPGATAGQYCRDLAKRLAEQGFHVRLTRPEKSKQQRFLPFASVAEAKFVNVVKDDWTDGYFEELESMDFTNKFCDDQADATSDAFYWLVKGQDLPTIVAPNISVASQQMGGLSNFQSPYQYTTPFTAPTFTFKT